MDLANKQNSKKRGQIVAAVIRSSVLVSFHSLFGRVCYGALMSALLFTACTSGRDLGYVYGNLEPAYYPKRFHVPGIIDVQKGSKREGLKIKEAENRKNSSLSLKF